MINKIKNKFCKRYMNKNGNIFLKYLYGDIKEMISCIVFGVFFIFIICQIIKYMKYIIIGNYEPVYDLGIGLIFAILIIICISVFNRMLNQIGNLKIASCAMIKNKNNKINEDNENEL